MICPKCQNDMEAIEYEGIEVDRCKNCQGIWFDVGESDWLRDKDAAAALDTGDPLAGRQPHKFIRRTLLLKQQIQVPSLLKHL